MEKAKEIMRKLLEANSPSGEEKFGIEVWNSICKELPDVYKYYQDKMGNSAWAWGKGETKVMISGHIDEISMAVYGITDDGYLIIHNMDGVDKKTLPGAQVEIVGDENIITGMVVSTPIHIQHYEKTTDEVFAWEDLRVDIGMETKDEVLKSGINIGSPVVFARNIWTTFGENRLVGNALDDKSGVFCTYAVLEELSKLGTKDPLWNKITVIGTAFVGEESGLRGATMASKSLNPDVSIDLDVTHAQFGVFSKEKFGDIKLGKGPVIMYGHDKSRQLNEILKKIAEEEKIPYQLEVAGAGGTNTDQIQLMAKNCLTTLISLPLTSMHTQNETMDWRDIQGTIKLLYEFLKIYNE